MKTTETLKYVKQGINLGPGVQFAGNDLWGGIVGRSARCAKKLSILGLMTMWQNCKGGHCFVFALSEIFSTSLHHVGESKVSNLDVEVCVK